MKTLKMNNFYLVCDSSGTSGGLDHEFGYGSIPESWWTFSFRQQTRGKLQNRNSIFTEIRYEGFHYSCIVNHLGTSQLDDPQDNQRW